MRYYGGEKRWDMYQQMANSCTSKIQEKQQLFVERILFDENLAYSMKLHQEIVS